MKPIKLQNIRPGQIIVNTIGTTFSYKVRGKRGNLIFVSMRVNDMWVGKNDPIKFGSNVWVRVPDRFYR